MHADPPLHIVFESSDLLSCLVLNIHAVPDCSQCLQFLDFAKTLVPACSYSVRSHSIPYEETGYYSMEVCKFFWSLIDHGSFLEFCFTKDESSCTFEALNRLRVQQRCAQAHLKQLALPSSAESKSFFDMAVPAAAAVEPRVSGPGEDLEVGSKVQVVGGDYHGWKDGLILKLTAKKAVVQFDKYPADLDAVPIRKTVNKTSLQLMSAAEQVAAGEEWGSLLFRRVMPAPGKDTYTLGDVAMMRRYVEEMVGRIFEIQRGRYEILQEMERLERMKTNKGADLRILDKLSEEIDISLTAVKVSLRTYELGGRCPLIRLPVARREDARCMPGEEDEHGGPDSWEHADN